MGAGRALPRFVIVTSTAGSVMGTLLRVPYFRAALHSVVADRDCPAVPKALDFGIPVEIVRGRSQDAFCAQLLAYLERHRVDYVISFYGKLFVGAILDVYRDRILNLHPSLLPAFKGLDGVRDALASGVRYVGTTIHFIDEKMDEGKILLQTAWPVDPTSDLRRVRHRLFEQQCRSLLQTVKWLADGRVRIAGNQVIVAGATYEDLEFAPNLDWDEAIRLRVPFPGELDWRPPGAVIAAGPDGAPGG
ncbi:MAG TPA: formyltransferase family protein [Isosphaeraceae bacterium]|jgi:phosphoribosylglycinamide formyltransferase-1